MQPKICEHACFVHQSRLCNKNIKQGVVLLPGLCSHYKNVIGAQNMLTCNIYIKIF